ncbi:MAG: TiaS agmantine-binding domain-containing protein [Candidatus Methanospirareceae archaeon]
MIIGIDDTDSKRRMCTTYICATLVEELKKYGEVSIPRLVRLNPCIPFKTRGNGATSFAIDTDEEESVKEEVMRVVRELADLEEEGTNPGVVFIDKEALRGCIEGKDILRGFYEDAVRRVLKMEDAYNVISMLNLDYFGFKNKRGVIGALAAAAFLLLQELGLKYEFTYELIAYRERKRWGTPRFIDERSVWEADKATYPLTWDTVDVSNKKMVFAPHSPCPVLFGIRGVSVEAIYKAYDMIKSEPVEREMLFITNQGTDFHLIRPKKGDKLEDFRSYILDGTVIRNPFTIEGGHVIFSIRENMTGERKEIDCAAYEPTKGFRSIIRKLRVGDEVTVYGSLKGKTLNIEKIEVRKLNNIVERNPRCPRCGRTMESAGRLQGYRCRKCKTYSNEKKKEFIDRDIEEGLYEVPPVARRHLSKPLILMQIRGEGGAGRKIHPSR